MNANSKSSVVRRKAEDPEGFRRARVNTYLKNVYGITLEDWEELFRKQSGLCAICQRKLILKVNGNKNFGVDHHHGTKTVRGLLCFECNWVIGLLHEDVTTLRRAIKYLKSYASS